MTAMSTANSGYIQRKIVKLCENIQIQNDGTVRDDNGKIYQFSYGQNDFDSTKTIRVDGQVNACDVGRLIDRLNMEEETGITKPKIIQEPKITSTIIYDPREDEGKKKKLIKKIKKAFPDTIIDITWSLEDLREKIKALELEEENERKEEEELIDDILDDMEDQDEDGLSDSEKDSNSSSETDSDSEDIESEYEDPEDFVSEEATFDPDM